MIKQDLSIVASVANGQFHDLKGLLASGLDPNATNAQGQSPLFLAASDGHLDVALLLLEHGANPNQTTRYHNTPLSIAAVSNHYDIAKALLQHDEKMYNPMHPCLSILKQLNAQAQTLADQVLHPYQHDNVEEHRHEKIDFLIALLHLLKQANTAKEVDQRIDAILTLEKRYQYKIFKTESPTKHLFQRVLRCLYTGKTMPCSITEEVA